MSEERTLSIEMLKYLKGKKMSRYDAGLLSDELIRKGLKSRYDAEMIRRDVSNDHH